MNISKFTQKSVQAVQGTEKLAYSYGNQQIEEEHLLLALLQVDDSLILNLIEKNTTVQYNVENCIYAGNDCLLF